MTAHKQIIVLLQGWPGTGRQGRGGEERWVEHSKFARTVVSYSNIEFFNSQPATTKDAYAFAAAPAPAPPGTTRSRQQAAGSMCAGSQLQRQGPLPRSLALALSSAFPAAEKQISFHFISVVCKRMSHPFVWVPSSQFESVLLNTSDLFALRPRRGWSLKPHVNALN